MVTAREKRLAPLRTPTSLSEEATRDISAALTALLADTFALYIKTKNFHWHVSGPHFRDYHLLLDEQSAEILAMTDPMARAGAQDRGDDAALHRSDREGIADRRQRCGLCRSAGYAGRASRDDNGELIGRMRETHDLCDEHNDIATASLLENWIDESEKRVWFLFESGRRGNG